MPSEFGPVTCGQHGQANATFVCQHIAKRLAKKFVIASDDNSPWPNAWCEVCEAMRERFGGPTGQWTDESEEFAGVTLLCHHCHEARRNELLGQS